MLHHNQIFTLEITFYILIEDKLMKYKSNLTKTKSWCLWYDDYFYNSFVFLSKTYNT